jgi:predicted MFS family arabinose efflux permease
MREVLSLPGYCRLASAAALNELCWFVGTIALSVLVYRKTGSVLGSSGFFLCSQAAPAFLGPPLVGRLDRTSPRTLLPVLYGVEAVLYAVLAWLTTRFALAPILILVVVDGVIALAARSIATAARTELLKPAGLVREGGALASISFSSAYLAGPLIGGFVTAIGGTMAALLLNCLVFSLMAVALLSRSIPSRTVHEGPERRRLRAAILLIRRSPPVLTLLTMKTLVYICLSIPTPLEVVYTVHTLHAGSSGYGILLAVWGGASLVGSVAYARLRNRNANVLLGVSIVLGAAGFAELAIAPTLAIALIGGVLGGLCTGLLTVIFGVQFQEIVPQSWMALASSVNEALLLLAPGIGIALGGLIASLVSVRFAFGVSAVASVVVAAFGLAALVSVQAAERGAAPEEPPDPGDPPVELDPAKAGFHSHTPA